MSLRVNNGVINLFVALSCVVVLTSSFLLGQYTIKDDVDSISKELDTAQRKVQLDAELITYQKRSLENLFSVLAEKDQRLCDQDKILEGDTNRTGVCFGGEFYPGADWASAGLNSSNVRWYVAGHSNTFWED